MKRVVSVASVGLLAWSAQWMAASPAASQPAVAPVVVASPAIIVPADRTQVRTPTPAFSGTGAPGATVTVLGNTNEAVASGRLGTVVVGADGSWRVVPRLLTDGFWAIRATQADPAGSISGTSAQILVRVDTTAPATPMITSPTPDGVVSGPGVRVTGTGEPGAEASIVDDQGVVFGPTTVTASGNWTVPLRTVADGPVSVTARLTDPAGNVSAASEPVGFLRDSVLPGPPVISSPADGGTGRTPPVIAGTGAVGGRVQVFVDAQLVGTVAVRADSTWSLTPRTLTAGLHTAIVLQTDARGLESADSAAVSFSVDAAAPEPPAITGPVNGAADDQRRPDLYGTGEPGATVVVQLDGAELPGVTVAGNGSWAVRTPSALTEGWHLARAKQTDPTGNVSANSPTSRFAVRLVPRPTLRVRRAPASPTPSGPPSRLWVRPYVGQR